MDIFKKCVKRIQFMIEKMTKERCSGCSACRSVCPKQAISMLPDKEGFLYPEVDMEKCVGCNQCVRVCPVLNAKPQSNRVPNAVVCASKEPVLRQKSTSGGFFAELAHYVLKNGGIVFGVEFDERYLTHHCVIEKEAELSRICRSKYIQSNVQDTYWQAGQYLKSGRLVLFSGTACQIAGLKAYLKKEYENLITCDVVCRGVMSPKLWRKYLDELEQKFHSKISYIGFREKKKSFHKSRMVIRFENGKVYAPSTNVEWISRFFAEGLNLRPSCYQCSFKGYDRASDFTMFDCWNLGRLVDGATDDDKGYTNVLLHTEKAAQYFEKIKSRLKYWPIDAEMAKRYDGIMLENAVKKPQKRQDFMEKIDTLTVTELGEKFAPIPMKIKVKEVIKNLLKALHIMEA